jgi:hypothetical protein
MTTIEITKRVQTVIQRAIEVKWDKFVAEGERIRHDSNAFDRQSTEEIEYDREPVYYNTFIGEFGLSFEYDFTYFHDETCSEDGMIEYDCNCSCDKEVNYQVILVKDKKVVLQGGFYKTKTMEHVMEYFSKLPTTITICQCGEVATCKGWCDNCYIKRQTHPEDEESPCAICHDYEGIWLKTDCNHYFHKSCFLKIESKNQCHKCPLCRNMVKDYNTNI